MGKIFLNIFWSHKKMLNTKMKKNEIGYTHDSNPVFKQRVIVYTVSVLFCNNVILLALIYMLFRNK